MLGRRAERGLRPAVSLCHMPAEPSLAFDQRPARRTVFREEGLQFSPGDDSGGNGKQLYATLLTGPDDVDRLDDERDEIHAFERRRTSSVGPSLSRPAGDRGRTAPIESHRGDRHRNPRLRLYTRPCVYTADYTARTTVARFERPDA